MKKYIREKLMKTFMKVAVASIFLAASAFSFGDARSDCEEELANSTFSGGTCEPVDPNRVVPELSEGAKSFLSLLTAQDVVNSETGSWAYFRVVGNALIIGNFPIIDEDGVETYVDSMIFRMDPATGLFSIQEYIFEGVKYVVE